MARVIVPILSGQLELVLSSRVAVNVSVNQAGFVGVNQAGFVGLGPNVFSTLLLSDHERSRFSFKHICILLMVAETI